MQLEMPSLMNALGIALIAIGLAILCLAVIVSRGWFLPAAPGENGRQEERVEGEERRG